MARSIDDRIAELQQKKERAARIENAKAAMMATRSHLSNKLYAQALTSARALVASLEALLGEPGKAGE